MTKMTKEEIQRIIDRAKKNGDEEMQKKIQSAMQEMSKDPTRVEIVSFPNSDDKDIAIQARYGAIQCPPDDTDIVIQAKYGALPVIHTSIPVLYGPVPATPSSPSSPSSDINITYAQLEENINTLKKSISTLKSSWNQETKRNINTINNSWAGKDCEAYTAKLTKMDGKVQNTIQALELLCNTYEKARDMIQSSQKAVSGSINNL